MSLTPQEAAELAALEAEESGLTPEEAAELAQLEQEEASTAPTDTRSSPDAYRVGGSFKPPENSLAAQVMQAPERFRQLQSGPGVMANLRAEADAARAQDPNPAPVMGTPPMAIPAGGALKGASKAAEYYGGGAVPFGQAASRAPESLTKLAQFLNKSAPGRVAANVGTGYVQGAADPNSTGKDGAIASGGIATAAESLGGMAKLAGWVGRGMGKSMTQTTKGQAKAYADHHAQGEELFNLQKNDPDQLAQMALEETRNATAKLQQSSTAPSMRKLNGRTAKQQFRVRPDQFEGTAAGEEIKRAHATQGKTVKLDVPVLERHQVQATPVQPTIKYGKPQTQPIPHGPEFGYQRPTAQVSTVEKGMEKAGEAVTLEDLLIPRGSQRVEVPASMPEEVGLTGAQLLRAKRASGKAMNANRSKNPLGYSATDDIESKASDSLRRALRDTDPKSAELDEIVEKNLRLSREAKKLPNPARIYTHSETLGDIPLRQIQQHFDEMTGSQISQKARALDATEAVHKEGSGTLHDLIKGLGRVTLRNSGRLKKGAEHLVGPGQQVVDSLSDGVRKKDVK